MSDDTESTRIKDVAYIAYEFCLSTGNVSCEEYQRTESGFEKSDDSEPELTEGALPLDENILDEHIPDIAFGSIKFYANDMPKSKIYYTVHISSLPEEHDLEKIERDIRRDIENEVKSSLGWADAARISVNCVASRVETPLKQIEAAILGSFSRGKA